MATIGRSMASQGSPRRQDGIFEQKDKVGGGTVGKDRFGHTTVSGQDKSGMTYNFTKDDEASKKLGRNVFVGTDSNGDSISVEQMKEGNGYSYTRETKDHKKTQGDVTVDYHKLWDGFGTIDVLDKDHSGETQIDAIA